MNIAKIVQLMPNYEKKFTDGTENNVRFEKKITTIKTESMAVPLLKVGILTHTHPIVYKSFSIKVSL